MAEATTSSAKSGGTRRFLQLSLWVCPRLADETLSFEGQDCKEKEMACGHEHYTKNSCHALHLHRATGGQLTDLLIRQKMLAREIIKIKQRQIDALKLSKSLHRMRHSRARTK